MTYLAFPSETDPPALAPVKRSSPWRDEAICAYVRKLWEDHSASEICSVLATEFGIQVGRNSVVGWLFRQNLTIQQKTKIHPLTAGNVAPRTTIKAKRPTRAKAAPKPRASQPGQPFVMRCAEVKPLHLTLDQLVHSACRYPYGDVGVGNGVTFCGHYADGHSYCPEHKALTVKQGWSA